MPRVTLDDLAAGCLPALAEAFGAPIVLDMGAEGGRDAGLLATARDALLHSRTQLVVGSSSTPLPEETAPLLEALAVTCAPAGPGRSWVDRPVEEVVAGIRRSPVAAAVLVEHLWATAHSPVEPALVAESATYSMLQAAPEFQRWLAARPAVGGPPTKVAVERTGDVLRLTLDGADRHNAFGASTRDALLDALDVAVVDPTVATVELRGAGASFCSGGDLAEFGTAPDLATAHLIRTSRSPARTVHRLRNRVRPLLHGACIGAGIEIPSFADRVLARDGTWFRLPELAMGLIPGAGGTVGITGRIGRWRCAWMALTGLPVDLDTALAWGLVDGRA